MPVTTPQPPSYYKPPPERPKSNVHRSQSLRSELSNNSQQSKRVSFNRDVHIKRIPRGYETDPNGKLVAVLRSPGLQSSPRLWVNEAQVQEENPNELYNEAQNVLKLVENLSCSASPHHFYDSYSLGRPPKKSASMNLHRSPSRLSEFFRTAAGPKKRFSKSRSSSINDSLNNLSLTSTPNGTTALSRQSHSDEVPIIQQNGRNNDWEVVKRIRPQQSKLKRRVGLNSIGETPTSSSEESGQININRKEISGQSQSQQETSESPISSLSGPEDGVRRYLNSNLPPPAPIISTKMAPQRPPLPKFNSYRYSSSGISNTQQVLPRRSPGRSHSTVTVTTDPVTSGRLTRNTARVRTPEVIYSQVVVSEPRNGVITKRTIHRDIGNGIDNYQTSNGSVGVKECSNSISNGLFVPPRGIRDYSPTIEFKPKNVTTISINSDEGIPISTKVRNNYIPEPEIEILDDELDSKPERTFFYGDSISRSLRQWGLNSSTPYFDYSNSNSSPRGLGLPGSKINSSKLVNEIDKNRDNFMSSAKLVNSFGPYTVVGPPPPPIPEKSVKFEPIRDNDLVDYKNKLNSVNGDTEPYFKTTNGVYPGPGLQNGFSNHSNSLEVLYKKKGGEDVKKDKDKKILAASITTTAPSSTIQNGGGLISTLMRRNKDKDSDKKSEIVRSNTKSKYDTSHSHTNGNGNANGMIKIEPSNSKQPRTRFLSGFLEKNFTLRRNGKLSLENPRKTSTSSNEKEVPTVTLNSNHHVLDS